jgi:hypothetical protein
MQLCTPSLQLPCVCNALLAKGGGAPQTVVALPIQKVVAGFAPLVAACL